jgi:RNA polymerase sigma factor (sigma-70 family)
MRDQFFQTALPVALRAAKIWAAKNKWLLSDPGWDTEDLAQDVLCRLYIALASFDAARASLFTYTERVVTNHIFSLQRKRLGCKGTRIEQGLLDIPTADVISRIELRVDVRRLVQALSHKDRIVAQLLMADSRPAEIAQRLGTSRAAQSIAVSTGSDPSSGLAGSPTIQGRLSVPELRWRQSMADLKIECRNITDLIPSERNARAHSP